MTTDIATIDDGYLQELSGMVNKQTSVGTAEGPAPLIINYEVNSIHERGCWVVGQSKKDKVIVDEGKRVHSMIILTTRLQYNCYNNDMPKNFYSSTFYTWNERTPKDKHMVDQKVAELGLKKAQNRIVAFGLAITEDGEEVPCIANMKGLTWMPFKEHLESITRVRGANGIIDVPEYTFVTKLPDTVTKQNGSNIFYIGVFERGEPITPEKVREYYQKAEEAHEWIEQLNKAKLERLNKPSQSAAPTASMPRPTHDSNMVDDDFITPEYTTKVTQQATQPAAIPAAAPVVQPDDPGPADSMADLEAEINAIL